MKPIQAFLIIFLAAAISAFAQEHQSTNDIITKMKVNLNLSDTQVTYITQVIDRYVDASNELQKSIDDGTINPSAIDSQKQQIKAAEDQGIAQYLQSDQLSQWRAIESQMDQQSGNSEANAGADDYSNLPKNPGGS